MKEEKVLNERECAVLDSMHREENHNGKTRDMMAPLCTFYDENFSNLVQEHEQVSKEDLTEKVDFILMDPP